jgi:hypothetical protein
MKGRGERIALVKGLFDAAAGLVRAGVVERHGDARSRAERPGVLPDGLEEFLRLPLAAREEVVFGGPAASVRVRRSRECG